MRIQVNLSDDMVKRLDMYADLMGVSRSSLCAQFIGQAVLGYDKAYSKIDDVGDSLINEFKSEKVSSDEK
jgi:metal-responsive CopG/Arc/MetJ family transcriptional regulator